ncbi:MAG: hypothetical protein HC913_02745 [Microscillaceae bacterium]|nr:hypothetical protein [Microscillaceae bacterium]
MKSLLALGFLLTLACVPAKKYKSLEAEYQKANIAERGREAQINRLEAENIRLENEVLRLRQQNQEQQTNRRQEQKQYDEALAQAEEKYRKLEMAYNDLVSNTRQEAYTRQTRTNQNPGTPVLSYPSNDPNPGNFFPNNSATDTNNSATNPSQTWRGGGNPPYTTDKTGPGKTNQFEAQEPLSNTLRPENQAQLTEIQNQLRLALPGYPSEQLKISPSQGRLLIQIDDALLFENDGPQLSPAGLSLLDRLLKIVKPQGNVGMLVENYTGRTRENSLGYFRAQPIADFFNQNGLQSGLSPKNYAPLAFETTGTEKVRPHSVLQVQFIP